jgi:signal transduction histidine kinase
MLSAASSAAARSSDAKKDAERALFTKRMWLWAWVPVVAISALHYTTDPAELWVHDVARRLYYLPVIYAALHSGLKGGVLSALVVTLTYFPHAFVHLDHLGHMDPRDTLHKSLEVVLYFVVGVLAGYLADQELRRRRELQSALETQKQLQHQLVRAGRLSALGEVVAGIAHEIKNPLHTLKGTAEIVDPLIPKQAEERRLWDLHVTELERLGNVAERFLSFARPKPIVTGPVDLREVAKRAAELMRVDADKKGVRVELELPSEPALVQADRDQLAQVALNIALNGVRALKTTGGRLRFSVGRSMSGNAAAHVLRIENDGPPIPEHEIEHLFDPFHGDSEGGVGLGLSICARIAEQHQGYIEAENAGLGVRFSVFVPSTT